MLKVSGGCACRAVRFSSPDQPTFSFQCQCRDCQQATGTGHASQFMVSLENLSVEGDLTFYSETAESGATVSRGFCPVCGSPIMSKTSRSPENCMINAASLDDSSEFSPTKVFFQDKGLPWDFIDPALLDTD